MNAKQLNELMEQNPEDFCIHQCIMCKHKQYGALMPDVGMGSLVHLDRTSKCCDDPCYLFDLQKEMINYV